MNSFPSFSPAAPEPLLAVACPTCFGALAVGADLFGRAADCPLCGHGFHVPTKAVSTTPPPAATPTPASPVSSATAGHAAAAPVAPGTAAAGDILAGADPAATNPAATRASAGDAGPPAPTADEPAPLRFREPVVTVGSGDNVVELRRLSPEEKAQRRARRNVVMLLTGVSILLAIVLTLGRSRR